MKSNLYIQRFDTNTWKLFRKVTMPLLCSTRNRMVHITHLIYMHNAYNIKSFVLLVIIGTHSFPLVTT